MTVSSGSTVPTTAVSVASGGAVPSHWPWALSFQALAWLGLLPGEDNRDLTCARALPPPSRVRPDPGGRELESLRPRAHGSQHWRPRLWEGPWKQLTHLGPFLAPHVSSSCVAPTCWGVPSVRPQAPGAQGDRPCDKLSGLRAPPGPRALWLRRLVWVLRPCGGRVPAAGRGQGGGGSLWVGADTARGNVHRGRWPVGQDR